MQRNVPSVTTHFTAEAPPLETWLQLLYLRLSEWTRLPLGHETWRRFLKPDVGFCICGFWVNGASTGQETWRGLLHLRLLKVNNFFGTATSPKAFQTARLPHLAVSNNSAANPHNAQLSRSSLKQLLVLSGLGRKRLSRLTNLFADQIAQTRACQAIQEAIGDRTGPRRPSGMPRAPTAWRRARASNS